MPCTKNSLDTFKADEKLAKMALAVNAVGNDIVDSVKARNKFQSLKSVYRKYAAVFNATGNDEIDAPPNHLEIIVFYFSGRRGFTGEVLAPSVPQEDSEIEDSSIPVATPVRP